MQHCRDGPERRAFANVITIDRLRSTLIEAADLPRLSRRLRTRHVPGYLIPRVQSINVSRQTT